MQIAGQVAVVTGGASGLGRATVESLHSRGAKVAIFDRNREQGELVASSLGQGALFVPTDVTSSESMLAACDEVVRHFGALHIGVGCAGIAFAGRTLLKEGGAAPIDAFAMTVQINLIGMFNFVRAAAAKMAENSPNSEGERGVLVTTASIAAFDGQIGQAAYAASKAGVAGMTLPLAREFSRIGIRVVTIAPGIFDTPMLALLPEPARQSLGQQVPFPSRLGRPQEYAALALHIVENSMLNGETIRLDGALRMAPK